MMSNKSDSFWEFFQIIKANSSKPKVEKIIDIREKMPNYHQYKNRYRQGEIEGIAIHHSASVNYWTGKPKGSALTFFDYQVNTLGWTHGGYNYIINVKGEIEYALDEKIAPFHAGFQDKKNSFNLEFGQYWNNHYIAICLSGWFDRNRNIQDCNGWNRSIPNFFIKPSKKQIESLLYLISMLRKRYNIPIENIRGHRELIGCNTDCPGSNFDLDQLRENLKISNI
jgi:hypothetical protein